MNHRAAKYTEIDERPIRAGDAVKALRESLPLFKARTGPLYDKMMATRSPGSTYPMARITAMHTLRLLTVLENMFHPDAQMYFSKNGRDVDGNEIECEWTVGAMVEEAKEMAAQ
jgi:hypothetical protein